MDDQRDQALMSMGNDITAPGEDSLAVFVPSVVRGGEQWLASNTITRAGDTTSSLPPVAFGDLSRFAQLPALDAVRAYATRARAMADRARWEAGVVARNTQAGHIGFAFEVSEQAAMHERSAHFFAQLARTALETWLDEHPDRAPSPGIEELLAQMDDDISAAAGALARARDFLGGPQPAA
jgi:hypothetical protein